VFGASREGHLFLTFVERDVRYAQPLVSELRRRHEVSIDFALVGDRFEAGGSRYIRSSLVQRVNRSSAALCLLGEDTIGDPWVTWVLHVAHGLGRRVLAAPLLPTAQDPAPLVAEFGAVVIEARPDVIVADVRAHLPLPNRPYVPKSLLGLLSERMPSLHLK
jgi:hypothetical protein